MKKPIDPRNHMKKPEQYKQHYASSRVKIVGGTVTVKNIKELINQLPKDIADENITIEHDGSRSFTHYVIAEWTESKQNVMFDLETQEYNKALEKFREEMKAFEDHIKRKIAGEKEDLVDEIARLEARLLAKKNELANKK